MARHRAIAETLVDACVEVTLCHDARDVARHVTALAVALLPHADGVVLHPASVTRS